MPISLTRPARIVAKLIFLSGVAFAVIAINSTSATATATYSATVINETGRMLERVYSYAEDGPWSYSPRQTLRNGETMSLQAEGCYWLLNCFNVSVTYISTDKKSRFTLKAYAMKDRFDPTRRHVSSVIETNGSIHANVTKVTTDRKNAKREHVLLTGKTDQS
jgi:hypothetical protein